jgi:hypothetical protein
MSELKYFVGKTVTLWMGEYDSDGDELLLVGTVEKELKHWLICRIKDDKKIIWINIKDIVYIQEGDIFDNRETVNLFVDKERVKKNEI